MSVITGYSNMASIPKAVSHIKTQFAETEPTIIIYFASSSYPPKELAKYMKNAFPQATVIGCSTAGEITTGKMLNNSIVAMALTADVIEDFSVQVLENIDKLDQNSLEKTFVAFSSHFHIPAMQLDPAQYVGLILIDGLSCMEEQVNDQIGNFTNVLFVGGSAGDDLKFKQTFVYMEDEAYTNAAILVIIKPVVAFEFIKTQSFKPTGKILQATSVDEAHRTIIEFNNRPAIEVYAEAIGKNVEEINKYFTKYSLGLMVDGEPFVRSPQQTRGGSMVFYSSVKEGMSLEVLEAKNMIADTAAAIAGAAQTLGGIQALLVFHCILRTLQLQSENLASAYGELFSNIPTVGFSTYGESFIGHINQTATMIAFGKTKLY